MIYSPPLLPMAARAAPVLTYVGTVGPTTIGGASSYTWSAASIGAAATGRLVVVCVAGNNVAFGVSSATIGGVAATVVSVQQGQYMGSAILTAVVPTGTTANVAVTFTGGIGTGFIGIWNITGLASSTAHDFYNTTGGVNGTYTATLDVPALGVAVAFGAGFSGGASSTWTGGTERFDYDNASVNYTGSDFTTATLVTNKTMQATNVQFVNAASWA